MNSCATPAFIWMVRGLVLLGLSFLAGCEIVPAPKADPTRYYVLPEPLLLDRAGAAGEGLQIGLHRIVLPSYLESKLIVSRTTAQEISYSNFNLWAEPLSQGIQRIFVTELRNRGRVQRVWTEPFPFENTRDYDISVEIVRCEGEKPGAGGSGAVTFVARLIITKPGPTGDEVMRTTFAASPMAWDGQDYGALANALGASIREAAQAAAKLLPAKS